MKYLFTLMIATLLSLGMSEPVEAKKFGGGGFGKAFKTSPFKKATPAAPAPASPTKPAAAPQGGKRPGMMGGLMGGLLAGGLFAYLLGSGAFEGLQFMDILLFGLLAFVLFKMFAKRKQAATPQYAGMQRQGFDQPAAQPQFGHSATATTQDDIPMEFPQGFDVKGFENGALEHFALVHKAWDNNDFSVIEEYVHPELLDELKAQRSQYSATLDNQIMDLSASIVRAEPIENGHRISILFRGLMKDMQSNEEHGVFDVWHLEKTANGAWLIVGIEAE